jgi:chromosome partitioning protein
MGKIIMIGSMKGGVSKTVTTYNLAYSLQKLGKKVLAVDFDSQANLSTCFGIEDTAAVPVTIGHLMMAQIEDEELPDQEEYIQHRNGVDFISSSMVLSVVGAKLRLEMGAEKMLSVYWSR